ncbi:MAG: type II toxin-antitoxin system VapC family toxin [Nitrospirae bacterium]|nr:type II toxin-antitoxin system VapC family toxin [Nitrospirota bacterium]
MTEARFVDTNVFVRYLTCDDEARAESVRKLLMKARDGKVRLVTNVMVMAELAWVLKSYYSQTDEVIAGLLTAVLDTEGLSVEDEDTVRDAVRLYALHGIDFVDAYIAAYMEGKGIKGLYSFDKKHMKRVGGITLMEP